MGNDTFYFCFRICVDAILKSFDEHIRFKVSVAEDHHHDDDEDHGGEEGGHTAGPEGVPERPGGPEVRFNIDQIIPIVDSILEQDDKVSIKLD